MVDHLFKNQPVLLPSRLIYIMQPSSDATRDALRIGFASFRLGAIAEDNDNAKPERGGRSTGLVVKAIRAGLSKWSKGQHQSPSTHTPGKYQVTDHELRSLRSLIAEHNVGRLFDKN